MNSSPETDACTALEGGKKDADGYLGERIEMKRDGEIRRQLDSDSASILSAKNERSGAKKLRA